MKLRCMALLAFALSLVASKPTLAIDPYTAGAIASQVIPHQVESTSDVRGTASALWYWTDPKTNERVLIGWNDDTAGVNILLPDFGYAELPVHFPNVLGKGVRMAAWTESGQADFRQDKPGKKRSRDRIRELERAREFGGADEVPMYGGMLNDGALWYIPAELSEWEAAPHLMRCGAVITGGKERTLKGLIAGLIGQSGSYAALDSEAYVRIGILKFTDSDGRILPEFWDSANGCPDFRKICKVCHLVPRDPRLHLPSAPVAAGPTVIVPPMQSSTLPSGESTSVARTQSKDNGAGQEAHQAPQQPASQPMQNQGLSQENGQDAQQDTEVTGTNQWLKVKNCTSVPLEVACERLGGGTSKLRKVLPGEEYEFEIPAGTQSLFRIWARKLIAGQTPALECVRNPSLPTTVTGTDRYQFPTPEQGKGKLVPISEDRPSVPAVRGEAV